MEVEALLNTLCKVLAEAKVNTFGDTLGDVGFAAMVDTSPDTLAWMETDPQHNTVGNVRAKALINTLPVTLQHAKPINTWRNTG